MQTAPTQYICFQTVIYHDIVWKFVGEDQSSQSTELPWAARQDSAASTAIVDEAQTWQTSFGAHQR